MKDILNSLNSFQKSKEYLYKNYRELHDLILNYNYNIIELEWQKRMYNFLNDIKEIPKCKCGNEIKRFRKYTGYSKYCSINCSIKYRDNIKSLEVRKNTIKEKYGVENVFQLEKTKEKTKETNLERYGVEHVMFLDSTKEKIKNTNLERYGVEHVMFLDSTKEKIKNTNLERIGFEHYMYLDSTKEKIKNTNLEKHGVKHPMYSKEIKEKLKYTNLERYGVENVFQNEEIKEKIKKYNLGEYGFEFYVQTEKFKEQSKNTMLERYGVSYAQQNDIIKNKILNTFLNNVILRYKKIISDRYEIINYNNDFFEILDKKYEKTFSINIGILYHRLKRNTEISLIQYPFNKKVSSYESFISDFLELNGIETISSDRKLLGKKEIDILSYSNNIGIEINGSYWHSIKLKKKHYHQTKSLECLKKGIKLFHIFEDDFLYRREIVLSNLKNLFLLNEEILNYIIKPIKIKESYDFIKENSLEYKNTKNSLGIFYNNKLYGIINYNDYEIIQICSKIDTYINFKKILEDNFKNYFYYFDLSFNHYFDFDISKGILIQPKIKTYKNYKLYDCGKIKIKI